MHRFVDEQEELDYGGQPHTVNRHCTDIPCCLVFLVFLAGFGYVATFGFLTGDPNRFLHLPNSQMQVCGVDEGVEDAPFVYFCKSSDGLNAKNTICVPSCPTPPAVPTTLCPAGMTTSYETRPLAGILCLPTDPTDALELQETLDNPQLKRLMTITEVFKSWRAIVAVAGIAIVMGFCFLFFLETCAFCIFWGSLGFCILVMGSLGGYIIYGAQLRQQVSQATGVGDVENLPDLTTGDPQKDLAVGIALCALAALFTCLSCCGCGVVNAALESLKEAADCITDIPSLLVQPFIDLAIKLCVFVFLVIGFWYLVSTARMEHTENSLGQYEIQYENKEYFFIGFYIFMSYWIMELLDALSNFVIAYAVQLWYAATRGGLDSGEAPCFPTLQGLLAGVTYHLGTFAFGSVIVSSVRVLRDLMFLVTKQSEASGNSVMTCCACCCTCCLDCFNRFLKFMTKNAYMDTAMNSNGFCKAAHHAVTVLIEHASEVATLNTTTILFTLSGVGGIAAAGVFAMHLLCTYWPALSDPSSPEYVENKVNIYIVAAVVSALVSLPFMLLLDQVSDTILFCLCIQKKRTPPPQIYQDDNGQEGSLFCGCCGNPSNAPNLANRDQRRSLING